jgi:hypothetical protein
MIALEDGVWPRVKPGAPAADAWDVTSRALSLLAGLASPIFGCAAIAAWLGGLWPANPLTLGFAALLVMSGPMLGILHVATTDEDEATEVIEVKREPRFSPSAPVINLAEARARAFHNWRDSDNPVIARRERERRASQYIRS